jgi:hypothetical protein
MRVQPNETLVPQHQETQRILQARYDSVLGVHIDLHYTTERGYHVGAIRQPTPTDAYAPGDRGTNIPQPIDITTEVEQVLRDAGIQVF